MKQTLQLFLSTFPNIPFFFFMQKLRWALRDCQTVLDVGCGAHSPLSLLKLGYTVGLDAYEPNIKRAKKTKTHNQYVLADARKIKGVFRPKSFNAVIALDLIEHLLKADGRKLLEEMEIIAEKRVVVFTPNGFLPQGSKNGNLEEHLSGWMAKDFEKLGYQTYGVYGLKSIRASDYSIRLKPKIFWVIISELSNHLYTWSHPKQAKALLCVKRI